MNVVQTVPNSGAPAQWQVVNTHGPPAPNTRSSNETRAGFKPRMVTAALQAILGFILLVCGIVVVSARIPNNYGNYSFTVLASLADGNDRIGWGIWIGACVIFTAAFGILSKKSQSLISLYMAFSIMICVMSFVGLWAVVVSLTGSVGLKNELNYNSYINPCKYDRYNKGYHYGLSSDDSFDQYDYDDCVSETLGSIRLHIACYSVMVICLVAEFIISIIGASFTCVGLDCCSGQPQQSRVIAYQSPVPGDQIHTSPVPPYTVMTVPSMPQQQSLAYNPAWATGMTPQPAEWSNPQYKGIVGGQSSQQAMFSPSATQNESTYLEPNNGPNQGNLNYGYGHADNPPPYETSITPTSGVTDEYYITVTE